MTEPDTGAFGNTALNVATSFALARELGAALCIRPTDPARLHALWTLRCRGVDVWPAEPQSWARLERRLRLAPTRVDSLRLPPGKGPASQPYFGVDLRRVYLKAPLQPVFPGNGEDSLPGAAKKVGIDLERSIVALHVRESGYKTALGIPEQDKDRTRNADIATYGPAVDWLVETGNQVVRIGDPEMTPFERPGVFDLASSPSRTDELELWVVRRSRFLLATDCGPSNLSILFGVPLLVTNMTHLIGGYPLRPADRYLPQHVDALPEGRELALDEMFTPEHVKFRFVPSRFRFRPNTPAELLEAVQEMDASLDASSAWTDAQLRYRSLIESWLSSDVGQRRAAKAGGPPFLLGTGRIVARYAEAHLR